jgi:hypothetical protein
VTVGQRFLLTLAIVLAILLGLALLGFFTGNWEEDEALRPGYGLASAETKPELCMDSDTRERVRALMIEALDNSLRQKVEELFASWLRDATDQPRRAQRGMDAALRAYVGARAAAMKFDPPECSG